MAIDKLNIIAQALEDYANVEELPKLEGKRMFLMLSPKK